MATTWGAVFEASPGGGDDPSQGDDRIRETKSAIRERLQKEHLFDLAEAGSQPRQGLHKAGSAVAFEQEAAPTQRNGVTLGTSDAGILWRKTSTGVLYVWSGSNWEAAAAGALLSGAATAAVGTSLGSIPVANGVVVPDLNAGQVRGIDPAAPPAGTYGTELIAIGGNWTIPAGLYMMILNSADAKGRIQIYTGSGWIDSYPFCAGGLILSDGTNYRVVNLGAAYACTVHYRKLA